MRKLNLKDQMDPFPFAGFILSPTDCSAPHIVREFAVLRENDASDTNVSVRVMENESAFVAAWHENSEAEVAYMPRKAHQENQLRLDIQHAVMGAEIAMLPKEENNG